MRLRVVRRAVVRRFAPVLRLAVFFAAVLRAAPPVFVFRAVVFFAALFLAVDLLAVERLAVERPLVLRPAPAAVAPPVAAASSIGHLPDITRSAASETASAISAPSLVALAITELAAWLAVSAASIPASLIALRAFGLALIAAAAAASPAASISLLIAAFVIRSIVVSFDFDDFDELDEPLRLLDFAIASSLRVPIDTSVEQQFRCGGEKAKQFCESGKPKHVKGNRRVRSGSLEHGQRPEVTAVRSAPTADEHPFPTCLLNHETSDHLLSLR